MTICYNLNMYKGADFVFEFRLKSESDYVNPTVVTFKAAASVGGAAVISKSLVSGITIDEDDDYLITITVPLSETDAIAAPKLYYEIDATIGSTRYRKLMGNINVFESIS